MRGPSDAQRLPEDAFLRVRQIEDGGRLGPVMYVIASRRRGGQHVLELAGGGVRVTVPAALVVVVELGDRPFADIKT